MKRNITYQCFVVVVVKTWIYRRFQQFLSDIAIVSAYGMNWMLTFSFLINKRFNQVHLK